MLLKNIIRYTASVLIWALAVVVFEGCIENSNEELQEVETEINRPSLSAKNYHTIVTDSGFYKYDFETPELEQYENVEDPYIFFPQGLTFKMYGQKGTVVTSSVKCNNAYYYKERNLWELNNDVEAITEKGERLNCEQLFWNTKEHVIYSDKFVKITTQNQVITGVGFESDEKLSKYEIKRPGGEIAVKRNE
jgi:LPS export ABC transporter protein LptC